MQISLNLAEIEAHPKCIRNKSSEILNFFSAEIPSLVKTSRNPLSTWTNEEQKLNKKKWITKMKNKKWKTKNKKNE